MKKIISLILCACLLFSVFSAAFTSSAGAIYNVSVNGYFDQTSARKIITQVNNFRADKTQAWAWDPTDTTKEYYTNLKAYTYDYELEQIAMKRATELAVYYGHTRPNGKDWYTAHTKYNTETNYSIGENVAVGLDTTNQVFEMWLETNYQYKGQSHRRNLLGGIDIERKFTSMAIACFVYEDIKFWCMLFRSANINPTPTTVSTQSADYSVELTSDFIAKTCSNCGKVVLRGASKCQNCATTVGTNSKYSIALANRYDNFILNLGDKHNLSLIDGTLVTTNPVVFADANQQTPYPMPVKFVPTITTSNSQVITVSGTTLTALNAGTAVLTATVLGQSIKINATVLKSNLTNAVVNLKDDTFIYTEGQTIVPTVESVTLNGKTVPEDSYDCSYILPEKTGTGVLTVAGKGNYEGYAYAHFDIIEKKDCTHKKVEILPAVKATCKNTGLTEGQKCATCGIILVEQTVVPLQGHKLVTDKAVPANCVDTGLDEGSHCSVCGMIFDEQEVIQIDPNNHKYVVTIPATEPTCSTIGVSEGKYCSACGVTIKEQVNIPKLRHTVVSDARVEPTCTKNGHTAGSHCSKCGEVIEPTQPLAMLGHNYTVSQYKKATLSANGYKRIVCERCSSVDPDNNIIYYYPKTFTLSKTNFIYTGKVQTPKLVIKSANKTLKNGVDYTLSYSSGRKLVGRYAIKVTFKGNYSGTKTLVYNIIPKATAITSIAGTKRGFTARWRKQAVQTTGYQVQYSVYSNFKTGTVLTARSVNSLIVKVGKLTGGKRYYVRVRTFRTVKYLGKNVNLYSAWSPIKSVKTKK